MPKENFQVAVKAIIFAKGKYLLLFKSQKEDVSSLEWDVPGGRIKYRERPLKALVREVKEETGIDVMSEKVFPLKTWSIQKPEFQLIGIDFLCILDSIQKPKLSSEHVSTKWLKEEEILKNKNIPDWLKEDIEIAEKLLTFLV